MSKKDLSLGKYNISKAKYRELLYFCMQYKEWQDSIDYGMKGMVNDGMPHGSSTGNPTEAQAIKNGQILEKCRLIENTARDADIRIWRYILQNVTEGTPYEYLEVPVGRRQFYEARKKFFYLLAERR